MKKTLVLILFCNSALFAQTPTNVQPRNIGELLARVIRPLVSSELKACITGSNEALPFYYSGETSFALPPDLERCLSRIPRDSFPNRNPYQDRYTGRILTIHRIEVHDSIARISATYSVIRGPYPEFWNYARGAGVEFRRRKGKWVETDRVEGES